jgi:hypothetical protein
VQSLIMLVTRDGRWVLPDSSEFLEALGDPDPDYDAIGFAVRNLGFVKFQVLDRIVTEIDLHPRNVGRQAISAVEKLVNEAGTTLFRVRYLTDDWHSEIFPSARATMDRLNELCAPAFAAPPASGFTVEPRDAALLFRDGENPMRPLAQKWRASFAHFDANILPLAMSQGLWTRFAIIGAEPGVKDPVWRFIGDAHRWLGDGYHFRGIGEKVQDIADKSYGQWVAQYFDAVATSAQPRYEVVTANIQYQNEPGRPRRPVHYERLLLPWKTGSGEVWVTSCAKIVSSGDDGSSSFTTDKSVAK